MASPAAATLQPELPTHQLQAIAFHMYSKCGEQTEAFQECMKNSTKPTVCVAEYKALSACAKELVNDAVAKAKEEWHHYTHCLELVGGKYSYCRPEKAKFDEAFPLEA